jgi:hypothetical protein
MSTSNIPKLLSYDEVWAITQESARLIQENAKRSRKKHREHEKKIAELRELFKQTDEQIKQTDEQIKKTNKQIKRTEKQLGHLGNRFGEMEEYLVLPRIEDKFNELNYHFNEADKEVILMDENKKVVAEVDIMLENDDFILCVEVKVKPNESDVRKHIERLKIVQRHYRKRRPKEMKVIGAIAGTVFNPKLKKIVLNSGLYLVVPSGNSFRIDVPANFQPRIFYGE